MTDTIDNINIILNGTSRKIVANNLYPDQQISTRIGNMSKKLLEEYGQVDLRLEKDPKLPKTVQQMDPDYHLQFRKLKSYKK